MCSAKSQTMEDRLTWTDTVSVFALHDAGVHPTILKMWGHLRTACIFFMRYHPGQHTEEHIQGAQDHLLTYARLVTTTWKMHELMTLNLHTCLVHVPEQARRCRPTAYAGEWWLERLMQVFKRVTKYRCTQYPETTAVQHWLLVQALDDWKLLDPAVSLLLDSVQADRNIENDSYDNSQDSSRLIGKLHNEGIGSPIRYQLMKALQELSENPSDDGMLVTREIASRALSEEGEDGALVVQLSSSKTASIKHGTALVRTQVSSLSRQDFHALVPYTTEDPSPAATVAACANAAADTAPAIIAALQDVESALPPGAVSDTRWVKLQEAVSGAQAAAAGCCSNLEEADQHADWTMQVATVVLMANKVCEKVSEIAEICEEVGGIVAPEAGEAVRAAKVSVQKCMDAVVAVQHGADYPPAESSPGSICTLMKVERLFLWRQNGVCRRLVQGTMTNLVPVGSAENGYEQIYCDGSRGRRKRVPSMLIPDPRLKPYPYVVWLDQVECPMVCGVQQEGRQRKVFYVPPHKDSRRG
jgi:hypothetical protein